MATYLFVFLVQIEVQALPRFVLMVDFGVIHRMENENNFPSHSKDPKLGSKPSVSVWSTPYQGSDGCYFFSQNSGASTLTIKVTINAKLGNIES